VPDVSSKMTSVFCACGRGRPLRQEKKTRRLVGSGLFSLGELDL